MATNLCAIVAFCISTSIIAWTYIVYPLLVRSLKRYYKPIRKKSGLLPRFSIVIPAYNEANVIGRKLENLLSLDYPRDRLETIVVDDGSTDNTAQIADTFTNVILVKSDRAGKTGAINKGLEKAKGEVVLLSDADCSLREDALIRAAQDLADESIGAVTGWIELVGSRTSIIRKDVARSRTWLFGRESMLDSVPTGMGGFLAFKRKLIDRLDPRCLADDVDITIRVRMTGFRVVYDPEIVTRTWDANIFSSWYKQTVRRTLQGLTTLFRHKSVIFNPKYGWYGAMILPTRLLLHRLTPFFLITVAISSFFISPILLLLLLAFSLIGALCVPSIRKMLVMQIIFLNAWGLYLSRRYEQAWEKGPRMSM
jgi:cellulose synthase/poly-beta-1,6-N-acetylglucosamine synthase-like glycosyltransferase